MKRSGGFTIVELLIVIVVIAILAAISVVAYIGIQNRAQSSSAMTSTKQASDALRMHATLNSDKYPQSLAEVNVNNSNNTKYEYTVNNSGAVATYCVASIVGSKTFYATNNQPSPTEGRCLEEGDNNVVSRLSSWTKSGSGVDYDSALNQVILSKSGQGTFRSPQFSVVGSTSFTLSFEIYATTSSQFYSPDGGVHTGSDYFASDQSTLATNTTGHTGNGNARQASLNSWVFYSTNFTTGPNVSYARVSVFSSPTSYTGDSRIRNVKVVVNP